MPHRRKNTYCYDPYVFTTITSLCLPFPQEQPTPFTEGSTKAWQRAGTPSHSRAQPAPTASASFFGGRVTIPPTEMAQLRTRSYQPQVSSGPSRSASDCPPRVNLKWRFWKAVVGCRRLPRHTGASCFPGVVWRARGRAGATAGPFGKRKSQPRGLGSPPSLKEPLRLHGTKPPRRPARAEA